MKLKHLYLILCLISVVATYWPMMVFIDQHGFNMALLFREQFATAATTFFGMDLLVVSVVALIFIVTEGLRLKLKYWWLPIVATATVGISLALPLFLFLREQKLTKAV